MTKKIMDERWAPIETAPKDEWPLLLGHPSWIMGEPGWWKDGSWILDNAKVAAIPQPTHWMRFPSPPIADHKM